MKAHVLLIDSRRVPSPRPASSVAWLLLAASLGYAVAVIAALPVPTLHGLPVPAGIALNAALLAAAFTYHRRVLRFAERPIGLQVLDPERAFRGEILNVAAALVGFFGLWQPLPHVIWAVTSPLPVAGIRGAALLAVITLLVAGPSVARLAPLARGTRPARWVPTYCAAATAFAMLAWASPVMTLGHLVYASSASGYALWSLWQDTRRGSTVHRPRRAGRAARRALRIRLWTTDTDYPGHYAHP